MSIEVIADAFAGLQNYFDGLPGISTTAARLAINDTARGPALKLARMQMNNEINFPSGYLNKDRLFVDKLATNADLEAIVTGRDRATSLARFATNGSIGKRGGVTVSVAKGSSTMLKKAFLIKLRRGKTMDGKTFNVGLAVRLAPGEVLQNRHSSHMTMIGNNVALLYGPSVDQVFKAVSSDIAPDVADEVATEFFRQFTRLSNG